MSWVVFSKRVPKAALRLFCLPYAGGGVSIYRNWSTLLPPDVEICSIQLPGRDCRLNEKPFTNSILLVEALAQAIYPFLDKPFTFFGHSMGAIIGFELARCLRNKYSLEPLHLFVSGRPAPQIPDDDPPTYCLPEIEFINELKRLNGTPKEVLEHPELMQMLIPILRADFEVCQTYVYSDEKPLNCSITAYYGANDQDVDRNKMEAWNKQTSNTFKVHMLPGDHFFINKYEKPLLHLISKVLSLMVTSNKNFLP